MKQKSNVLWFRRTTGLLILCLVILTLWVRLFSTGQSAEENINAPEKLLSQLIFSGLERWHYNASQLDDNFSEKALDEYVSYLDYSKRFFLESDIRELDEYKDKLDDQLAIGSTSVMEKVSQRLKLRLDQVMKFYEEMLSQPFDFSKPEIIELDPEKQPYCTSMEELKESWRKALKYRTLLHYITLLETEQKKPDNKTNPNTRTKVNRLSTDTIDPVLEEKARKAVLKSFKSIFNRMKQSLEKDSLSRYFNAIVRVCDPHSVYFPPVDKVTFNMQMSGRFEGIGASLQEEDGYVKVVNIIPGGPSWRQKSLQAGDLILKVGQADDTPEDIIGMRVEDAVKLIRGKKGTMVRLTVKKPDGQIVEIPILRDIVILEETFAKSAVITHKKTGKRFGYIYLPGFYNDFENEDGRNATDDVKKEVEKLKTLQVDGIILDLRGNSGGALNDAVRMSGLFIPGGPIVQVKNRNQGVKSLDDPDPGVLYNGPLIVMVNSMSASASEILAGALQDYNRAIIIGGNQSFGKGTVQAMVNLDRILESNAAEAEQKYGALTITIQKFYRVTGRAIQLRGVIPDIILPDPFDYLEIGERYLDYALTWDNVKSADFKPWSSTPPASEIIKEKSRQRVEKNPVFHQTLNYIARLKKIRENTTQNLQLKALLQQQDELKTEQKKLDNSQVEMTQIEVTASAETGKRKSEQLLIVEKEEQERWFKDIRKDAAIGEAIEILNDTHDIIQPHYSANKKTAPTDKNKK